MKTKIYIIGMLLASLPCISAGAQTQDPAEVERKTYEYIENEIEKYTNALKLEDWQVFYIDSIMTHDVFAMKADADALTRSKISNTDLYLDVQDKWNEATYVAFRKVLDDNQWAKYCKMGAARDKKARDKRAAAKKKSI